MSNFETQTIASRNNTLILAPGASFAFVAGLGGQSIRSWYNNAQKNPWWAATASSAVSEHVLLSILIHL